MAYKSSKTVTSYSSQKTTRSIETTKIVSKTQTSSSGLVSSYRPTATADRATSSAASSVNKTYQPVYDQTRRLAESGISTRNSPAYSSLRGVPTTSFSQNALSKAGGNLFYSFGNSKDNNRSTSLVNNERTGEVPVPTWKSSTTVAPTSAPVAGTSRQFRSASVPVLSRSVPKVYQQRVEHCNATCACIIKHTKQSNFSWNSRYLSELRPRKIHNRFCFGITYIDCRIKCLTLKL